MKIAHLVMTRFAVRWPGTHRLSPTPLTPAWLEQRFSYFARYCVPSLQAQTLCSFRWLVYVHDQLDPEIARRLQALDYRIELRTESDTRIPAVDADLVISTRVDSDDALASDVLIQADQMAAKLPRPLLLLFARGHVLRERDRQTYVGPATSFSSLIEAAQGALGVRSFNSEAIVERFPVTRLDRPSWIRVVHGGNIRNQFKPKGQTAPLASLAGPLFPWLEAA